MELPPNIGCSTLIFRELPLSEALERISINGFNYADICAVPDFCPHLDILTVSDEVISELNGTLEKFKVHPATLNIFPGYLNSNNTKEVKKIVEKSIFIAKKIGAGSITIPSGAPTDEENWIETVKQIKPHLLNMANFAHECDIELSVEAPHKGTLVENIDQAQRFFDLVSDERVRCTFDTSHVTVGKRASLVEGLKRIGLDRINHIHLRDSLKEEIRVTPGKGQADFVPFMNELKRLNYTGSLIFELEYDDYSIKQKERELKFACSFVKSIVMDGDISLSQKIKTSGIYQLGERLYRNPKAEIKRHKNLHTVARKIKNGLFLFYPIKTYEGVWKNRWRIRRNKVIEQRPHSVKIQNNSKNLVRVGILGCGWAGTYMHGPAFQRLNNVKLVGMVDIDEQKAKIAGRKFSCNTYTDLEEFLEKEKPDLVSICTREWQHYEPAIKLLNSGVDVFCEKIMASRYEHGLGMVEAAKKNGRVLALNYNYRFMPGIRKMKEIIQEKAMGYLCFIDIKVHAFSYHHALDLLSYLGGTIKSVSAIYNNNNSLRDFGGTDWSKYDRDILYVPSINLSVTFELENEALATINSTYLLNANGFIMSIDSVFEYGAISLSGLNMFDTCGHLSFYSKKGLLNLDLDHKKNVFSKGYEYTFYKSIEAFITNYIDGNRPETTGEDGLYNMQIEKIVSESNKKGCRIFSDSILSL